VIAPVFAAKGWNWIGFFSFHLEETLFSFVTLTGGNRDRTELFDSVARILRFSIKILLKRGKKRREDHYRYLYIATYPGSGIGLVDME
jgi:hypothetical protein